LPPWWNQSSSQRDDDSKTASDTPATADDNERPRAHAQPDPSVGPILEQYSIQPRKVETVDDRARALSHDASPSAAVALPPVGPSDSVDDDRYGIQPGDLLAISVWREPELTREVRVSPDGRITYPLVGELNVDGTTVGTLRTQLETALKRFVTA